MNTDINRLKIVLAEKKIKSKWLAEQIGKDPATVSKWCTNTTQPSLDCLWRIAEILDVDIKDLLNSNQAAEPGVVYLRLDSKSLNLKD